MTLQNDITLKLQIQYFNCVCFYIILTFKKYLHVITMSKSVFIVYNYIDCLLTPTP